jgi:hypothetical protein
MADDLKTFREVTQSIDNFKTAVNGQFGTTHRILYYFGGAIVTVLIGIFSGTLVTYREIGSLQTDSAVVKNELKGMNEKLGRLGEILTTQNQMQVSLARIQERLIASTRPQPEVLRSFLLRSTRATAS